TSLFCVQAEDGIRDATVTGVQTCALPISSPTRTSRKPTPPRRRQARDGELRGTSAPDLPSPGRPKSRIGREQEEQEVRGAAREEIGRASCREGVAVAQVDGSVAYERVRAV